jgi:hypothetical protein
MTGEELKNDAPTTAAFTGPSGAARPAKYPRPDPRSHPSSNAERASGAK